MSLAKQPVDDKQMIGKDAEWESQVEDSSIEGDPSPVAPFDGARPYKT